MTKLEKIHSEYEKLGILDIVKDKLFENGWCSTRKNCNFAYILLTNAIEYQNYWWRPASLKGIDDNNGWITIETIDDLPQEYKKYHCIIRNTGRHVRMHIDKNYPEKMINWYSHYQEIKELKLPLH